MESITIKENSPHGQFFNSVYRNPIYCCRHTNDLKISNSIGFDTIMSSESELWYYIITDVCIAINYMHLISITVSIRNCSRCPLVFITMNICVAIIYMAMLKIIKTYCDIPQ